MEGNNTSIYKIGNYKGLYFNKSMQAGTEESVIIKQNDIIKAVSGLLYAGDLSASYTINLYAYCGTIIHPIFEKQGSIVVSNDLSISGKINIGSELKDGVLRLKIKNNSSVAKAFYLRFLPIN